MTIKDIAKLAGVSIATVSYVLNGKKKVSPKLRDKILQIIAEVGYESSVVARDFKKQTSTIFAICLESLNGPFFSDLIAGIEQAATESEFQFVVATSYGNQTSSAHKLLKERRVAGAIILAPNFSDEFLLSIAYKGLPLVLLDRKLEHTNINTILLDNHKGIEEAIAHLVAQKISQIGFIHGTASHYDSQQRSQAFYNTLNRHDLKIYPEWIFAGNFRQDSGVIAAEQLLEHPQHLPQAMLCANDEMALGLQTTLQKHNIQIPEQISIIGFDDILIARYLQPTLSTISHPKFELGYLAFNYLLQLVKHEAHTPLQIETHFIQRASSL